MTKRLEKIQRKFVVHCYNEYFQPHPPTPPQTELTIIVNDTLCMTEHNKVTQFLFLILRGYGSFTSSINIIGLGLLVRNVRDFPLFHDSPGVPLRHIHFVVIHISSESEVCHLVRFDIIFYVYNIRCLDELLKEVFRLCLL